MLIWNKCQCAAPSSTTMTCLYWSMAMTICSTWRARTLVVPRKEKNWICFLNWNTRNTRVSIQWDCRKGPNGGTYKPSLQAEPRSLKWTRHPNHCNRSSGIHCVLAMTSSKPSNSHPTPPYPTTSNTKNITWREGSFSSWLSMHRMVWGCNVTDGETEEHWVTRFYNQRQW